MNCSILVFGAIILLDCSSLGFNSSQLDSKPLINAMEVILDRFYSKETSTIFIMAKSALMIHKNLRPNEIVGEIIRYNQIPMCYVLEERLANSSEIFNRFFNIFVADNYDSFRRIFIEMSTRTYDYTGFYTIILTEPNDDCQETVAKIFQDCWSLYITNVNILTPTNDNELIVLYTYFPFTLGHCESTEPVIYDYFENNTFIHNAPIFPDKFHNFYECPQKASSYTFPPFMMLNNQSDGSYYADGIEGITLRVMSQRLNFTLIMIPSGYNIMKPISNSSGVNIKKPHLRRSLEMV